MFRAEAKNALLVMVLTLSVLGCGSHDTEPAHEAQSKKGPYAKLGSVTIYFEVHGEGYPLLLLHGGFSNSEAWELLIPGLAQDYQVIIMDSRGHGRSTDAEVPITYELLASDAVALLDYLGLERAHVVGWSDGGVAGLHMGVSHPERLDKLVTIGASAQGPGSLHDLFDLMFSYQSLFNFVMDLLFLPDYERLNPHPQHWPVFRDKIFELWKGACYFQPEEGEDCMAPLEDITTEVLVVAGQLEMIRKEHTEALHQHLPNSEILFIPFGTHMVIFEQPEKLNEAILDFL